MNSTAHSQLPNRLPERAVINGDGSVTLPLRVPVEIARINRPTRTFAELVFRPLTRVDIGAIRRKSLKASGPEALARLTRIDVKLARTLFDAMDMADFEDCRATIAVTYWNATTGKALGTPIGEVA